MSRRSSTAVAERSVASARPEQAASGRARARALRRAARGLAGAAVAFLALEWFTRLELVDPTYLPRASTVLARLAGLLVDPDFLLVATATLQAWGLGLLIATVVAVPAGVLLGASRVCYRATRAIVDLARPIPSVALIPLAILLFGLGLKMKIALIVYGAFWPVLFNTIYGVQDVDPVAKDTARAFGFGRLATLARVSLPSSAPFIVTGVRIASSIALILAISAELISGGDTGVGGWMRAGSEGGDARLVYAGTMFTGVLGLVLNQVLQTVERRLFGWQPHLAEAM
jgi:NitT/TauT family transport system permease protein